jgi:hypothetical protein
LSTFQKGSGGVLEAVRESPVLAFTHLDVDGPGGRKGQGHAGLGDLDSLDLILGCHAGHAGSKRSGGQDPSPSVRTSATALWLMLASSVPAQPASARM